MKTACRHARKCPGCTKLQFPYVKQVHDKDRGVHAALGKLAPAAVFAPVVPSPLPLGYRSSTKLCLHMDSFGQRSIGLYERGTKKVVGIIPDCPVHHADINRLVQKVFGGNAPLPAPFYNHQKKSFQPGCLKFVTVRIGSGEAGLVLSHTGVERGVLAEWARGLDTRGLSVYEAKLTRADDDRILSDDVRPLAGRETFRHVIAGNTFELTPLAFFQANHALTDAFVEHIVGGLAGKTLLDLYGGFGAYSLAAGKSFQRAYLVDGNEAAIKAGEAAAKAAGLSSVKAVYASVEDFLARGGAKDVTHVIVNPPRAGLSPKVKAKLTRAALPALEQLVYVSCNPATLGRDLAELTRQGLMIQSITPFDMFPQTEHVEVVVKLCRR